MARKKRSDEPSDPQPGIVAGSEEESSTELIAEAVVPGVVEGKAVPDPAPETAPAAIPTPSTVADGDEPHAIGMNRVMPKLAGVIDQPLGPGYRPTRQEVRFTGAQAELLVKLHNVLGDLGVKLNRPTDALGWLLDQVAKSAAV